MGGAGALSPRGEMNQQADLVRASFALIRQAPEPIILLFYGRLFELDPTLRNLFKIDMRVQARKLIDTLTTVVDSAEDLEKITPMLHALGRRHVTYGVQPQYYDLLKSALLWAMGQALQEDFDRDTRQAWSNLLNAVTAEMIQGSSQPWF